MSGPAPETAAASDRARRLRVAGAVLGALTLSAVLAVWRTWPLAVNLRTGAPTLTFFDWLYTAWSLAWQVHALRTGTSPAAANIYHPAPDTLYYGPLSTGLLPLFAPVYLLSGNALLSLKVAYIAALALTGVSVHLVVRASTRSWLAGALAVLTLFTCESFGTLTSQAPQWAALAFYAPLTWAFARAGTWRGACLVAVLAAAQCVTEPVYVAPAVLAVVGTAAALRLLAARTRPAGMRLIVAAGGAVLLLVPLLVGFVRVRMANPGLSSQTIWLNAGFFASLPNLAVDKLLALPKELPSWFLLPTLAAAALTRVLDRRRPPVAPGLRWLDAGILFVMPFALMLAIPELARLPWFRTLPQLIRAPQRLVLGGLVGVALVGGLAWAELAAAARARRGHWSVAVLTVAAALPLVRHGIDLPPLALGMRYDAVPPIGTMLLSKTAGPILELPVPKNAGEEAWIMYRSLSHWRPLLNGYASYWPAGWDKRMADVAGLPDRTVLARLVRETGVATILVRRSKLPPDQRARWTIPLDPPVPGLVPVPLGQSPNLLIFNVDAGRALAEETADVAR